MAGSYQRAYPIGPEVLPHAGVDFRVWAPASASVAVECYHDAETPGRVVPLAPEEGGYFSGVVPDAGDGLLYRFKLPSGSFPDPASRFQPLGPHGVSQVVSGAHPWTDEAWRGLPPDRHVIYEMHLGTFTPAGNWRAAEAELPALQRLGITMIEVMPIADFPGAFGWGYDGVNLFAPSRLYGTPADLRSFVDRAHALGLAVILDVVYNHFGPDGNYLRQFSPGYFNPHRVSEWGDAIHFDGPGSAPVREFFVANACYWIREFHFDGLRFDATQQIFDESTPHILAQIVAAARASAPGRTLYFVAEMERQEAQLVRAADRGGHGLDAIWNDDFHHSAMVAATGRAEAYYMDYRGAPQEFISALKHGFLFQGQWHQWQVQRRGRPAFDVAPAQFVNFLQNHDQVANSLRGARLHQLASPGMTRALTALTLLGPGTPLLFQGQEFAASAPFLYFADHHPELAEQVGRGRAGFLRQFRSLLDDPGTTACLAQPHDRQTFERCRLDPAERGRHAAVWRLHADLLRIRRDDRTLAEPFRFDGAVLGASAFVLRYFSDQDDDRLLLVNLGADLVLRSAPEPLLAPVEGRGWGILWSSESVDYLGGGTAPVETREGWLLPGQAAVLLGPVETTEVPHAKVREKD